MLITQEQLGKEIRVDSATSLVQDLTEKHGIDPLIILVLDTQEKVNVLYKSPKNFKVANLDVEMVTNTRVWPQDDEVIKTIYPGGGIGFCTPKILGKRAKWFPGP